MPLLKIHSTNSSYDLIQITVGCEIGKYACQRASAGSRSSSSHKSVWDSVTVDSVAERQRSRGGWTTASDHETKTSSEANEEENRTLSPVRYIALYSDWHHGRSVHSAPYSTAITSVELRDVFKYFVIRRLTIVGLLEHTEQSAKHSRIQAAISQTIKSVYIIQQILNVDQAQ